MKTEVVHWNDRSGTPNVDWVYIGRSIGEGYFGNPFLATSRCGHSNFEPMGRDEAIRHYRDWFYDRLEWDEVFRLAVHGLKGKVLVCHCKPLACHGDVIAEYLNR